MFERVAFLLVLASVAAVPASAQESTTFGTYRVVDVAANDHLNMRANVFEAGSAADAPVVAAIPPNATGIEATGRSTTVGDRPWVEVRYGGQLGGVSTRFVAFDREPDPTALPGRLTCEGTEPFWHVSFAPDGATMRTPESSTDYSVAARASATNAPNRWVVWVTNQATSLPATAIVMTDQTCTDGMSDMTYPMEVIWIGDDAKVLSGCCSGR